MLNSHTVIWSRALPVAAILGLAAGMAHAQGLSSANNPELLTELRYIELLNNAQMPDYAEEVLRAVEAKFPAARPLIKVKKLEQILMLGKFDEAEKIIKAEPNQDSPEVWSMRTTLADYLYARNRYDDALDIYKRLFAKYKGNPPESIQEFYLQSAYKYAQMLVFLKDDKGAEAAYRNLLAIKAMPADMKRQVQYEHAQLLVKLGEAATDKAQKDKYFADARKVVEALLWQQDLWFGRAVALLAHLEVAKGDLDKAQKLLEDYREQLLNIDEQLRQQGEADGQDYSHLSPMAEARYQTGVLLMTEGRKILEHAATIKVESERIKEEDRGADAYVKALNDLTNVYVQYPSFAWAPEAMAHCERITAELDALGFEVTSDITPQQRQEVAKKQFQTANMLYHQNQFENAINTYERVLAAFPEQMPESVQGLHTMARACVEYADGLPAGEDQDYYRLYSETIAGYLAERFANRPRETMEMAGNLVQDLSRFYAERNMTVASEHLQQLFYSLYPEHSTAASSLMADASKLFSAEPPDYAGAARLFEFLATKYTRSASSLTAHRMLGICYERLGERDKELAARASYVRRLNEADKERRDADVMAQIPSAVIGLARLRRNIVIEELRDARNALQEARRGGAAAAPAPAAEEAPAAPVEGEVAAAEGEAAAEPVDPVEAATKRFVEANKKLANSIKEYTQLVRLIDSEEKRALYQRNVEDKKQNESVYSSALYDLAYCYNALSIPETKIASYKQQAAKYYEQILTECPWAENMYPATLLQLGTLYTTLPAEDDAGREVNAKKASEYFDRLAKDFADSEQARNALFLQGRALMELGYNTEAIAKFREMINSPGGRYSAYQLKSAAESLFEAKDYETARQAYAAASKLLKPEDTFLANDIAMGIARIDFAEGKYLAVADAMEKFINDNPTSGKIIEANNLLSRACVEATMHESDAAKRTALFRRAIQTLRLIQRYREKDGAAVNLDLRVQNGDIIETQAAVEAKHGNPEEEMRYLRQASSHYFSILSTADYGNAALRDGLEKCLFRYIRILSRMKTFEDGSPVWEDLKLNCETYIQNFPSGPNILAVRNALAEANVGLATSR